MMATELSSELLRLDVVLFVGPIEGGGGEAVAEEVDGFVFEGHGEGVVHAADDGDGGVLAVELVGGVVEDGDDWVYAALSGSPEPVGVVAADGGGQAEVLAGAEDVDGSGLAVVVGEDGDAGAVLG